MVHEIHPDKLLAQLCLEPEECHGATKTRRGLANGIFLKRRMESDKAAQELRATQLARLLLPTSVNIPGSWGLIGEWYVSSYMPDSNFVRSDEAQAIEAARVLASIHESATSPDLRECLRNAGFCHYDGNSLAARLRQEADFALKAFASHDSVERFQTAAEQLAEGINDGNEDQSVLGHGDYQASNLMWYGGHVWPIDWTDFGLCHRWYEVAHFAASLDSACRETAICEYAAQVGISDYGECFAAGDRMDCIIRGGSRARAVLDGIESKEHAFARFQEVVARLL